MLQDAKPRMARAPKGMILVVVMVGEGISAGSIFLNSKRDFKGFFKLCKNIASYE
jgi:hypothetical protein